MSCQKSIGGPLTLIRYILCIVWCNLQYVETSQCMTEASQHLRAALRRLWLLHGRLLQRKHNWGSPTVALVTEHVMICVQTKAWAHTLGNEQVDKVNNNYMLTTWRDSWWNSLQQGEAVINGASWFGQSEFGTETSWLRLGKGHSLSYNKGFVKVSETFLIMATF